MLTFYAVHNEKLQVTPQEQAAEKLKAIAWVDLFEPTREEETFAEALVGVNIPTPDEMREIELSSRLYQENGALYATATIVTNATTPHPGRQAITFILVNECLLTVRYADPQPFKCYLARVENVALPHRGSIVLAGLMDAVVDRLADILEIADHSMDDITTAVFHADASKNKTKGLQLHELLRRVGRNGDLISKARESLFSLHRLLGYVASSSHFRTGSEEAARMQSVLRDVGALNDHASFLSNKVGFLLDAILGMLNIEQNGIIKIFSVAAVVFLPPTLVASVYGMNFEFMPELKWRFGYPLAFCLMALSAFIPFKYFQRKGWL